MAVVYRTVAALEEAVLKKQTHPRLQHQLSRSCSKNILVVFSDSERIHTHTYTLD